MARTFFVKRYNGTLPLPTAVGFQVFKKSDLRVGAILVNRGTGTVYIAEEPNKGSDGFPLNTNDSVNFLPNSAPTEPLFAWGDAAHDLRVMEVIELAKGITA